MAQTQAQLDAARDNALARYDEAEAANPQPADINALRHIRDTTHAAALAGPAGVGGAGANVIQQLINLNAGMADLRAPRQRVALKKLSLYSSGDGTEWLTWRRNFEQVRLLNGWNDLQSRRQASSSMEGIAARAVQAFPPVPLNQDPNNPFTIDMLLAQYEAVFLPAAESSLSRAAFHTARQAEKETVLLWHSRLRELFTRAYPGVETEPSLLLKQQFTLNLADKTVRVATFDHLPANYAEALEFAHNKAASNAIMAERDMVLGKVQTAPSLGAVGPGPFDNISSATAAGMTVICHFCEKPGHIRPACPLWIEAKRQLTGPSGFAQSRGRGNFRGNRGGGGFQNSRGRQPYRGRGGFAAPRNAALNSISGPEQDQPKWESAENY
jgi:hypothetical protein